MNNLVVVTGNHIADKGNAGGRGIYTVIIRFILISWLGLNLNRLMYSLANASALPKTEKSLLM